MANLKQDALVGVGSLERMAQAYDRTAKTLRKLAKGLRKLMAASVAATPQPQPSESRKRPSSRRKGHSTAGSEAPRKKGMSPARRKALSDAMKARWAARRAEKGE